MINVFVLAMSWLCKAIIFPMKLIYILYKKFEKKKKKKNDY